MRLAPSAVLLVFALGLAAVAPPTARAQEIRITTPPRVVTPLDRAGVSFATRDVLSRAPRPLPIPLNDPMQDVRLSRGAKVAIIVGAIVVGVLLIAGLIVLAEPGRRLP